MADSSSTVRCIPNPIAGACWARSQLHGGIRYVPVETKLRISLASVEVSRMATKQDRFQAMRSIDSWISHDSREQDHSIVIIV